MKYVLIGLIIAAVLIVIRGAGGDDQPQLSQQIELQGPQQVMQLVLIPDGDAVPFCSPLRGCVGGHWELL
jgi:hypothetical protein